jgi:2-dehydropantoate 2-reductase
MAGSIAMVGAGAVGLYFGGRLAAAGEDVRFLVRSDYEGLRRDGLTVESVAGDFRLESPRVFRSAEEIGPVDLAIVTWKTTANRHYEEVLTPLMRGGGTVLTLQNGLGNTESLAGLFGAERVMGGLCFVCINRIEPGLVRHTGGGRVTLGEMRGTGSARLDEVVDRMQAAGISCRAVEDLAQAQWKKLVWNVPFNGLAIAGGGVDTQALLAVPEGESEVRALMAEVQAGAKALGHTITEEFLDQQVELTRPMGCYRPSSMIDYVEGRDVEVESIWAEPLRRAKEAGAALPRWERLLGRIREKLVKRRA